MNQIDQGSLRPGDVLLHNSIGEISKLIEWAGDCTYSHAALVYDGTTLREAAAVGVRTFDLAKRLDPKQDDFHFIDAYRRTQEPAGLAQGEVTAVRTVADGYKGATYPLNELALLGLTCALRNKIPADNRVKLLLREIIDHFINRDPQFQVCSEFVYRCYAEAPFDPSLRPRIMVTTGSPTPFPKIDWRALWKDYQEANQRAHPGAAGDQAAALPRGESDEIVSDEELLARYATARETVGLGGSSPPLADRDSSSPVVDREPNPRTILPSDILNSPDFQPLGRVLVGPP